MISLVVPLLISIGTGLVLLLVFPLTVLAAVRLGADYATEVSDLRIFPRSDGLVKAPVRRAQRLSEEDWDGFFHVWNSVCERFTDAPRTAVTYADLLLSDLMVECRGALTDPGIAVSKEPTVTDQYDTAHEIAIRAKMRNLNSEELTTVMSLYSGIIDDLLRVTSPN